MIEISRKRLVHLLTCNAGTELKLVEVGKPIVHYYVDGTESWEEKNEQIIRVPCETCKKIRKLLK